MQNSLLLNISFSIINFSELVSLHTYALFFHSHYIVSLDSLQLSPLVAFLSPLVLKHKHILSSFCSSFVEQPNISDLLSDLIYLFAHLNFVTSTLNSGVFDLSIYLFLEKLKTYLFIVLFLLSLCSLRLSQD